MRRSTLAFGIATVLGTLAIGGCGGSLNSGNTKPQAAQQPMSCDQIASLKLSGVTISSAKVVAATSTAPETCAVAASIAPTADGYNINFNVTLPTSWNGKAIQGGGGGYNGSITPVTGPHWATPAAAAAFPFKGYATYSSDSGHQGAVFDASFALKSEALQDFGYAALKKVKDAATQIIVARYAAQPTKTYLIGFSEGGREALEVAQRYPDDYDGVVAGDPVQNLSLQWLSHLNNAKGFFANNGAGWIDNNKVLLLGNFVMSACDELDGLKDGIIANQAACKPDITPLRCPGGTDTGDTCLSDAQIAAVNNSRAGLTLPYTLSNGLQSIQGKPWGTELIGNGSYYESTFLGSRPVPSAPEPNVGGTDSGVYTLGNEAARYIFTQNASLDPRTWNWNDQSNAARMQQVSGILDSSVTDLSAFHKKGGKILIYAGGASEVPPAETQAYYLRVVQTMGQATVNDFVRLYTFPGTTHVGLTNAGTPRGADLMSAFENWVEKGVAPGNLTNISAAANTATESWPLCLYPGYPRYNGSGDPSQASSFTCTNP
ncbi:pimeloyl-ACP methyl ester carboxylesterase [Paraburkholderia sp. WC7.3g]|uniref:tannase/feruloyl esterase family alpha/beta hydrolase n=1 Tax=Paraburkholderia sp. WC7.3g TaxID=2991070 RepID=UPI003D1C71C1